MKNNLSFSHSLVKILTALSLLCILLVACRIYYTGGFRYLWLIWNLFLAWIPLFFVMLWHRNKNIQKSNLRSSFLLLSWLIFFTNAPYILTDLFHLLNYGKAPLWYDLILILSFAWTGLLTGFVSLMEIQNFFNYKFGKFCGWCVSVFALILGSFGVYIGRYGRFNSWEIITNPFQLSNDILTMIVNPLDYTRMYGMTFFFSCFLILTYLSLVILIESKNKTVNKQSNEYKF